MKEIIAYYRVSTDKQGASGLGLAAQQEAVKKFATSIGATILHEFTEVESGKRSDRPVLAEAIERTKFSGGVLVIAKLDRLARSVSFISTLLESGIEVRAADMPDANKLTLHILAAVAEYERDAISERTKRALAAAKARGVKLGNPRLKEAQMRGGAAFAAKTIAHRRRIAPIVQEMQAEGLSLRAIARRLNDLRIKSFKGSPWSHVTVKGVLEEDAA